MSSVLTPDQIAELVTRYNFADRRTAIAVVLGESGGDPRAVNREPGNIDRGLWQISSKWHPNVTDAQAFDVDWSTRYAHTLSSGGTDYNAWHVTRSARWSELYEQAGRVTVPGSEGGSPGLGDIVGSVPYLGDAVGAVTGAVTGAVGAIASPFAGIIDLASKALDLVSKALGVITSGDFWRRVGFAVTGVVLLYLGLAAIFGRQALGLGITAGSKGMVDGSEVVGE